MILQGPTIGTTPGMCFSFIVPAGATYSITPASSSYTIGISKWSELR